MKPLTQEELQEIRDTDASMGIDENFQFLSTPYTHRRQLLQHIDALIITPTMPARIPVAMLLWCPQCGQRHIDEGEYATTKHHHTHACQHCGMVWRPAVEDTVGVQFLHGFKNEPTLEPWMAPPEANKVQLQRTSLQYVVIRKSCMHCGSMPLATERGVCEDCGRYQTPDGNDPSGELV